MKVFETRDHSFYTLCHCVTSVCDTFICDVSLVACWGCSYVGVRNHGENK